MPDSDVSLLTDAALAAGEIAVRHFYRGHAVWDKGQGQGPVTEADLDVDKMLKERLLDARSDYGWLSEETEDDPARLTRSRVFVIDPIDGTRSFVDGHRTWAHSLAVVENGTPVAAVVYLPLRDKLYVAGTGTGARLNDEIIRVSETTDPADIDVLAARPTFDPEHWPGGVPHVARHFRSSLAYRMSLVGEGRYHGMLTLRPTWEWDIAAGCLIASEAGGRVTDRNGAHCGSTPSAVRPMALCVPPPRRTQISLPV